MIKLHLIGNSSFVYFKKDCLWYIDSQGMIFPIPTSEVKMQLMPTEKSTVLMKWIKREYQIRYNISSSSNS